MTDVGGTLFFDADDGTGDELWQSVPPFDSSSTTKIDVNPSGASFPGQFAQANGSILFAADGGTDGFEPWKCSVPCTSPTQVEDINTAGDSNPSHLASAGGIVFFEANDASGDFELWKSSPPYDATSTSKIDVNPTGSSDPAPVLEYRRDRATSTPATGCTAPSCGGAMVERRISTEMVADINANRQLHPRRDHARRRPDLLQGGGTGLRPGALEDRPVRAPRGFADIFPGNSGSAPNEFTDVGGTLLFEANDDTTGQELWKGTIEPAPPPPPATTPATVAPRREVQEEEGKGARGRGGQEMQEEAKVTPA